MTYTRSPEQEAYRQQLLASPSQSVILNAVAGSGKTATLIDNLDVTVSSGSTCLTAFNKKMAGELEKRVAAQHFSIKMGTEVGTAHSLAFRGMKKAGISPRVFGGKGNARLQELMDEAHVSQDYKHPLRRAVPIISRLSGFAKNAGFDLFACDGKENFANSGDQFEWERLISHYNLESDLEDKEVDPADAIKWARLLFTDAIETGQRVIDFDDMIYLPLYLQLKLPTYSNVLVDEAQDTNATRRELAIRSLRKNASGDITGRLIAVGDPHQAIYGFTGADAYALRNIQKRVGAVELPLSVCWRCDEKIIEVAQRWVPHIRSHDTEGKGQVDNIDFDQLWGHVQPGDAILCRLNRPNVSVCVALIRRGMRARIEGRDLGEKLLSHAKKASKAKAPLDELQLLLEGYAAHQIDLLQQKGKQTQAALLEDEIDCLHVLIDRCLELGQNQFIDLEAMVAELFVDGGADSAILLSSIHKGKGLEFNRVFWLGKSDYQPFFMAQQDWELEQEDNLCYVTATRARHYLFIVHGVEEALKAGAHRQMPAQPKPAPTEAEAEANRRDHFCNECGGLKIDGKCENHTCIASINSLPAFLREPSQ